MRSVRDDQTGSWRQIASQKQRKNQVLTAELEELIGFRADHVAFPLHTSELQRLSNTELEAYLKLRKRLILDAEANPLANGYIPHIWTVLDQQIAELRAKFPKGVIKLIIWGGHRSSKTRKASNYVLNDIVDHPGHRWWCCSEGTLVTTDRGQVPIERVIKGDRVLTRAGFRKVTACWDNGERPVVEVMHERGSLFVTEDHELLTRRGWVQARNIIAGTTNSVSAVRSNVGVFRRELMPLRTELSPTSSERFTAQNVLSAGQSDNMTQVNADFPATEMVELISFGNRPNYFFPKPHSRAGTNPITMYQSISSSGIERPVDALICVNQEVVNRKLVLQSARKKRITRRTSNRAITGQDISTVRTGFHGSKIHQVRQSGRRRVYDLSIESEHEYIADGVVVHNCCDSTEAMARTNQMRLLWEQMPEAWKNVPRDQVTDIRYSVSDGFPKNKFITPTASEVEFKFYSIDVKDLPGPEIDGIWGDELMPLDWVKFAMFRLVNRNGIFLLTFTPEFGWNDTIQYFYEGAQIIEESEAELLPKYDADGNQLGFRMVPRIMQCADPTARIIFFHTKDNPFGNYPGLVQELKGKSEEEILIRAYGVCSKSHTAAFPMFSKRAHVITQAQFGAILKQNPKTLRFQLLDPCDGRNWFMIWVACPRPDKWLIYREWPSHGHPKAYIEGIGHIGPWALSGAAADGVMGPAQKSFGFSLQAYVDEILRQENGEDIFARYIDSRYATSPRVGAEHVTSLIEQIGEVGMDFLCMVPGKGRIIGMDRNDGSVDLINSALYYDVETELGKFSPKLSRLNEPQLQVVETCPNTIYALEHWTGQDGQKGACKDCIDVIRGLFLTSVNYIGDDMYSFVGGGR